MWESKTVKRCWQISIPLKSSTIFANNFIDKTILLNNWNKYKYKE